MGATSTNKAEQAKAAEAARKAAADAAKTPEERAADAAAKAREKADYTRAAVVAQLVKNSLKNPASFQLEYLTRTRAGALCLSYRATNSFNAIVPGHAVATPDDKLLTGSETDIASAWNKHCASSSGDQDLTSVRHSLR